MALLAWFNTKEYFDAHTKEVHADERTVGLTLEQLLSAHAAWHERFIQVMHGANDADFELAKVYQDKHSFLGKWLYGEASALYGHLAEYDAVCKAYAAFHGSAGVALGQHQMGNEAFAQQFLKTNYRMAFNTVKMELVNLFSASRLDPLTIN